ncbi:MAG: hypothetical protein HKN84_05865 [Gammaproteobacteria bacterium]|nr:hypothetical protein [Gammaproteobacteria bacterium]
MARAASALTALLALASISATAAEDGLRDLYFGEALFYANQGEFFEALERLDAELGQYYGLDEPTLDTLHFHVGDAEFSVGDFELSYRMHHRAGRAITAVLEGDVEDIVRNEAAFRLARIHFQKDQLDDALNALGRIEGETPEAIEDDVEFLRANIYLATDRSDEATDVLRGLQGSDSLESFAAYNLGIAMLQGGREADALQQLDRAGQLSTAEAGALSIRDKSNLVLGTLLLESDRYSDAIRSLDRVRLEGPLSNQALLSAGWAAFYAENFERAIVPWSMLAERDSTDPSVQEAMLALPYAYSQLSIHGRSAVLYGQALDGFGEELGKLDASIESIREGSFLEALIREEIRQDKDWVIQLRSLPETPETYYLMELLASHDFHTSLQNYLDLEDLRAKLDSWQSSFDAFEDMIEIRRQYYEPLLPDIDQQFRELDSRIRLRQEQHALLEQRMQSLLVAPRPEFLATVEERRLSEQLSRIEQSLGEDSSPQAVELRERTKRLRGLLTWSVRTAYHERLTEFGKHLAELKGAMDVMKAQYDSFVRVRQAALHSYEGYDVPITRLRTRVREASARVALLMARQGRTLELVAINELVKRRDRLENYRDQARYALADSYDRATAAQTTQVQE